MYRMSELVDFFFSSRRRHTRSLCDWSSDVCSSDLAWNASWSCRRRGFAATAAATPSMQIGRAAGGGREEISGVGVSLKKKKIQPRGGRYTDRYNEMRRELAHDRKLVTAAWYLAVRI